MLRVFPPVWRKISKAPAVWVVAFLLPHVAVESPWPGQESRGHLCVKPHVWKVKVYIVAYIYRYDYTLKPSRVIVIKSYIYI